MTLADLLHESRWHRVRAIQELPAGEPLLFALRRVLFTDLDAEVRSSAALRLGELGEHRTTVEAWLLDAIGDSSPLVRDSILRSLARTGSAVALPALRELAARDSLWWVRRGAVYALGAIAGAAELPALTAALGDPFWRVRHAAVRVLSVLGARDPAVRDDIVASESSTAMTFLRGTWGPVALEAPARAASSSMLPAHLLDPDPAVVTARLAEGHHDPLALVELLCDPHVPLRVLAVQRLLAAGSVPAFEAALDWLEEPRIPHVVDTVHRMLDQLGDIAHAIAERSLARSDRRGAAAWAIGWVVATRSETLYELARERARAGDARLRRLALRLVEDGELVVWAAAAELEASASWPARVLVDAIGTELHERRTPAAWTALLALDGARSPIVRTLQIDLHARADRDDAVALGLADGHHGPRAIAARYFARRERAANPRRSIRGDADPSVSEAANLDADPAVREAAILADTAHAFVDDVDPWVRRAAIDALARAWHGRHVTAALPAEVAAAAQIALHDREPWIRARSCELPIGSDAHLAIVIERLGDPAPMVRAAAHASVESLAGSDDRVRALLDRTFPAGESDETPARALAPATRALAYGWLLRSLDDAARTFAGDRFEREPARDVRRVLAAVAGIELPAPAIESATEPVTPPRPAVARRPFGRAGFEVAPLAISGAYDLSAQALRVADEAGVDLYFWEPGYDVLTRHLRGRERRERVHVITGSYHAEPPAIEADVDRALRKLRRDTLDVFLLFWTRSSARVDADAFAVLERLKRAGKVRAIGFSTHFRSLAREAIEARPWDVVMIRHSAAHPGIETELLPTARERGTAIVTFSALTYGRMIAGPNAPSAADCYRYSLSQPGVTACISAPRRQREVVENLGVLSDPQLSAEQIAALREHGRAVHVESQRFNTLVRQPTRDAAAAARELLASEPPPVDGAAEQRLPQASSQRRSKTRLGRRAR